MDTKLLNAVLDELIPPGDGMPGAGEIGLAADIERALQNNPAPAPVITQGLTTLNSIVGEAGVESFAMADDERRLALMKELEAREPGFIPTLMFLGFSSYYMHPRVVSALGLETRPPHPKGYEMAPNDLTLLEPIRRRPKMFRPLS